MPKILPWSLVKIWTATPIYAYVVEFTTYGIFISKSGWRFVSFEARAKLFDKLLAYAISGNFA